jgi:hypothetical protein
MALMAMARSRLMVGNAHTKTRTQILSMPSFVHLCILFFCVREEHVPRCRQKKYAQDAHHVGPQPQLLHAHPNLDKFGGFFDWVDAKFDVVGEAHEDLDEDSYIQQTKFMLHQPS